MRPVWHDFLSVLLHGGPFVENRLFLVVNTKPPQASVLKEDVSEARIRQALVNECVSILIVSLMMALLVTQIHGMLVLLRG